MNHETVKRSELTPEVESENQRHAIHATAIVFQAALPDGWRVFPGQDNSTLLCEYRTDGKRALGIVLPVSVMYGRSRESDVKVIMRDFIARLTALTVQCPDAE